jgi:hypothetical protein
MWYMWWRKWYWGRFSLHFFGFPFQFSLLKMLHTHPSSRFGTVGPLVAGVLSRRSLALSHEKILTLRYDGLFSCFDTVKLSTSVVQKIFCSICSLIPRVRLVPHSECLRNAYKLNKNEYIRRTKSERVLLREEDWSWKKETKRSAPAHIIYYAVTHNSKHSRLTTQILCDNSWRTSWSVARNVTTVP